MICWLQTRTMLKFIYSTHHFLYVRTIRLCYSIPRLTHFKTKSVVYQQLQTVAHEHQRIIHRKIVGFTTSKLEWTLASWFFNFFESKISTRIIFKILRNDLCIIIKINIIFDIFLCLWNICYILLITKVENKHRMLIWSFGCHAQPQFGPNKISLDFRTRDNTCTFVDFNTFEICYLMSQPLIINRILYACIVHAAETIYKLYCLLNAPQNRTDKTNQHFRGFL